MVISIRRALQLLLNRTNALWLRICQSRGKSERMGSENGENKKNRAMSRNGNRHGTWHEPYRIVHSLGPSFSIVRARSSLSSLCESPNSGAFSWRECACVRETIANTYKCSTKRSKKETHTTEMHCGSKVDMIAVVMIYLRVSIAHKVHSLYKYNRFSTLQLALSITAADPEIHSAANNEPCCTDATQWSACVCVCVVRTPQTQWTAFIEHRCIKMSTTKISTG